MKELTFNTLYKIYFPLFVCCWKSLETALCVFFFLKSSHIFTNNYHGVLYVYLCTERSWKAMLKYLYICKILKKK